MKKVPPHLTNSSSFNLLSRGITKTCIFYDHLLFEWIHKQAFLSYAQIVLFRDIVAYSEIIIYNTYTIDNPKLCRYIHRVLYGATMQNNEVGINHSGCHSIGKRGGF